VLQTGYNKGGRTVNIFITNCESTKKQIKLVFCKLEMASDSINRESLRFKMRKIYVSKNIINCTKTMYDFIKFCAKCGANQIHSCAPQAKGIH
jgi:hypothetical protein